MAMSTNLDLVETGVFAGAGARDASPYALPSITSDRGEVSERVAAGVGSGAGRPSLDAGDGETADAMPTLFQIPAGRLHARWEPPTPPEYVRALLYHARDDPLEQLSDTPEVRRKGWQRIALFGNFFMPGSLRSLDTSYWLGAARRTPVARRTLAPGPDAKGSRSLQLGSRSRDTDMVSRRSS